MVGTKPVAPVLVALFLLPGCFSSAPPSGVAEAFDASAILAPAAWSPGTYWSWSYRAEFLVVRPDERNEHVISANLTLHVLKPWVHEGRTWWVARLSDDHGNLGAMFWLGSGASLVAIDPQTWEGLGLDLPARPECEDLDEPETCSWHVDWNETRPHAGRLPKLWTPPLAAGHQWQAGPELAFPYRGRFDVAYRGGHQMDGRTLLRLEGILDPSSLSGVYGADLGDLPRFVADFDPELRHFRSASGGGTVFVSEDPARPSTYHWNLTLVAHGFRPVPTDEELIAGLDADQAHGQSVNRALGGVRVPGRVAWSGATVAPADGTFHLDLLDGLGHLSDKPWRWELVRDRQVEYSGNTRSAPVGGLGPGVWTAYFWIPAQSYTGTYRSWIALADVAVDGQVSPSPSCTIVPARCTTQAESPGGTARLHLHLNVSAALPTTAQLVVRRNGTAVHNEAVSVPFSGSRSIPSPDLAAGEWAIDVTATPATVRLAANATLVFDIDAPPQGPGVRGVALHPATCPDGYGNDNPDCGDVPHVGRLLFSAHAGGRVVGEVTTDHNGTFDVLLAPGYYEVTTPKGEPNPGCHPTWVRVHDLGRSWLNVPCIRVQG
jgi:hypothetical protein